MPAKRALAMDLPRLPSNDDSEIGRLESLADFSRVALTSSSIDELIAAGMATLVSSLDVDYAKLLRLLDGHAGLKLQWGLGWNSGYVGEAAVAPGAGSQAGFTLTQSRPVIVENFRWETRFNAPALLVQHRVNSGMSVTVRGRTEPFGVIGVHCRNRRRFSPSEVVFLHSVAKIISAAVSQRETTGPVSGNPSSAQARAHSSDQRAGAARVLRGWKEIAAYIGSGVRTAQRWEHMYALPVHRPARKLRSSVISATSELDDWVQHSPRRE